jgi:predicted permease
MNDVGRDICYALRGLFRAPLFAATAVLTLALGVGANTAVFSVVNGVLLRPLPHADGDRLVYLRHSAQLAGIDNERFSVPEIIDFREAASFTDLAEFSASSYNLTARGEPQQILAGIVTGNFFEVMGLRPEVGRVLDDGDNGETAAPVIVLTYDYWMRAFGGDPNIVGDVVDLGGMAAEVVGVVQQAPHYPERTDVMVNMVTSPHHLSATMVHGRTHRMTEVFGRLAPGATVERARSDVEVITERIHREYPESYQAAAGYTVAVSPLADVLTRRATGTIYLLWTTAALVLLIACASVANLVLTRSVRREREFVVRAALGAGVRRLRRLLLAESLVLALAGSAVGVLVALGGVDLLTSFAARFTPRAAEVSLDGMVLGFTAAMAMLLAVALGFVPAVPGSSGDAKRSLTSTGTRTIGGRHRRVQSALVVAQVALSVTLLNGAGLLVRTLVNLYDIDVGADVEGVLTIEVPVAGTGKSDVEVRGAYARMRHEMASLPGVSDAGVGSTVPLRDNEVELQIKAEDVPPNPDMPTPRAEYRTATPEYFAATGIPILAGRAFEATETKESGLVVILNETLAKRLFPEGIDPIGRRVAWTGSVLEFIPVTGDWRTVVGIAGDTHSAALDQEPRPAMYQPFEQEEVLAGSLVVRSAGDPESLLLPATQIVRRVDPSVPIGKVGTLASLREESVANQRVNALLVSGFGVVALLIAAVGLAGVLGFSVSQRTGEIGVRMSLGAEPGQVRRMVVREGVTLLLIGLVLGAVGSVFATKVVEGMLFGVAPNDPTTLGAVALLMVTVGVTAAWVPAMRASRVQPVEALRQE